jgi:hypothetical protein
MIDFDQDNDKITTVGWLAGHFWLLFPRLQFGFQGGQGEGKFIFFFDFDLDFFRFQSFSGSSSSSAHSSYFFLTCE